MIIVTGSPRTGTSSMMLMLGSLGVKVVGLAFHRDFSNVELNPKGYWELPIEETVNGIHHDGYKGCAVKLFGAQLSMTPAKYVSKALVCLRDKEKALPSIKRLIESEMWQLSKYGITPSEKDCERTYDTNYALINQYVEENEVPCLRVTCEDIPNSKATIEGFLKD